MRRVIFIDLSLRKLLRWCSRSAAQETGKSRWVETYFVDIVGNFT